MQAATARAPFWDMLWELAASSQAGGCFAVCLLLLLHAHTACPEAVLAQPVTSFPFCLAQNVSLLSKMSVGQICAHQTTRDPEILTKACRNSGSCSPTLTSSLST